MKPNRRQVRRLLDLAATPAAAVVAPPGVDLGSYELLREVGRGAMGVVYEAHDGRLDRRVALKLLGHRLAFAGSPVMRERFVREAQAAARLGHPHIAAVYEATPDYIAMQFVDGDSLDVWIEGPDAGVTAIVRLLRDAARAVQHAHEMGVIHRDLKPSNLLVGAASGPPQVVVTDFGLAKLEELDSTLSASGDVLGTPGFMAPEQAAGGATVDERADVYGLGATLYACLTGAPPFVGEDVVAVLQAIREDEPAPVSRAARVAVNRDLHTIVHKCLRKEAAQRYATAGDLADDLDRWLEGEPITARPPTLRYRTQKFLQRRRSTLRVALAVTAVGGLVVAWLLLRSFAVEVAGRRTIQLASEVENLLIDAEDLFRSGRIEEKRQTLDRAATKCRAFLVDYPLPRAHLLLARVLRQNERYAAALVELDAALALDAGLDEARFERGLLLAEYIDRSADVGGPDSTLIPHYRAQAVADLGVARADGFAFRRRDVLFGEAVLARLTGDRETARARLLAIATDLDPAYLPAILVLSTMAFEDGNEVAAQRWSSRIVDLYRGGGKAYRANPVGQPEAAWSPQGMPLFTEEQLAQGHVAPVHVLRRGTERLQRGDLRGAREDFERVLELDPAEARAAEGLGRTHLAESEVHAEQGAVLRAVASRSEAGVAFDRALAIDPGLGWAMLGRGEVRLREAAQMRKAGFAAAAEAAVARARADLEAAREMGPGAVRSRAESILASGSAAGR